MAKVGRASRNASLKRVETIGNGTATATAKTITSAESGEVYIIDHNHASALTITLPAKKAGAYFKFIFKTDMTANGTVVITSAEDTDGDFEGAILEQITGGSNADSAMVVCGNHHKLTISDDIDPGSYVECVCDGSVWIFSGALSVSALGLAAFSS